jgi:hypothetical protein
MGEDQKMTFYIYIYILTDELGEWWEYLKTDGSLDKFERATHNYKKDKQFSSLDKAIKYAKNNLTQDKFPTINGEQRHFQIIGMLPPIKPSITYSREIMYDSKEK